MGERCPSDSGGQTVSFIVDYVPGHPLSVAGFLRNFGYGLGTFLS